MKLRLRRAAFHRQRKDTGRESESGLLLVSCWLDAILRLADHCASEEKNSLDDCRASAPLQVRARFPVHRFTSDQPRAG